MWAKIYKLYCNENDDFYVGSTRKLANVRLQEHLTDAVRSNSKKSIWIRESKSVKISAIDYVEYEDYAEVLSKETYWINKLHPTLNTIRNPLGVSRNSKIQCEICNKLMNKSSISRHMKLHRKTENDVSLPP